MVVRDRHYRAAQQDRPCNKVLQFPQISLEATYAVLFPSGCATPRLDGPTIP